MDNIFREQYENDPEWIKYRSLFPAILTYDDFTHAMNDGNFHALIGMIVQIDNYRSFSRAWIIGGYTFRSMTDSENMHSATCYLPEGAKEGDILFLVAKLTPGRKGETDLKYIKHHIIPYQKPTGYDLSDSSSNNYEY